MKALAGAAALVVIGTAASTAAAKPRSPVLGVLQQAHGGVVVQRYDRATLRPYGAKVRLPAPVWTWSRSPGGTTIGLLGGGQRTTVALLDAVSLRRIAMRRLERVGNPFALRWVAPGRLLLASASATEVVVSLLDAATLEELESRRIPGRLMRAERTRAGIAFLLGPQRGFGISRLGLVDGNLAIRTVPLSRIRSGFAYPPENAPGVSGAVLGRLRSPALAVDRFGAKAVVVGLDEPVAEVDVERGTVAYHVVAARTTALGAKLLRGPDLQARFLRSGDVAVTGTINEGVDAATGAPLQTPFGLAILDTRAWNMRIVDPAVEYVIRAGDWLVATGRSAGITWFDAVGRRRGHALGARNVTDTAWTGTTGLVRSWEEQRTWRIDLSTGLVVGAGDLRPPLFLDAEPRSLWG